MEQAVSFEHYQMSASLHVTPLTEEAFKNRQINAATMTLALIMGDNRL